ncbi:unannotated protein [freshwater metagenome]|uniref:Unannotated protein n=1 Tax=freshwater metagenome TaxID=449393 RepID=A0A6J7LIA1_9ZZZZ
MVVDRHRQRLLRGVLADDVLVEEFEDLPWLGEVAPLNIGRLVEFLFDDLVAQVDALVADVHTRTGNELLDLLLALPTEGALQQVAAFADPRHDIDPSGLLLSGNRANRL